MGVQRAIEREILSKGKSGRTYRVIDKKGAVILEAGDLALPPKLGRFRGILDVKLEPKNPESEPTKARVLSFGLEGKSSVFIAISTDSSLNLMHQFWKVFLETEILIVLLGLGVGFWLAHRFWGQVEAFNRLSMRIVNSGNLASRMPVEGNNEFAVLAANMNNMLDRIEKLFQGIRQVSDNIAHDLRSPLTRLRADVEVTLQENDPETYRAALERVLTELQNMQDVFNSLLSIGQAEAGSLKLRKKQIDLSELLEDILDLYTPLAEENDLQVEAEIMPGMEIEADRQLLAQAMSNLFDNAIKYVPGGGKVVLTAMRKNDKIEIKMDDTGPGIPEDMRQKVFDRFTRVDPSRTLPGTGLGLSLVKAFVELHQGTITLTDSELGGTSFTIILPVS